MDELAKAWYPAVLAAAKQPHARFVVVASVYDRGGASPALGELIEQIKSKGYVCEYVNLSLLNGQAYHGHPKKDEAQPVLAGKNQERGWLPETYPKFGGDGSSRFLIVKWG